MISIEECLRYADECEQLACSENSDVDRATLLEIAENWRCMAINHADRPERLN